MTPLTDPTALKGFTKLMELGHPVLTVGQLDHHIWVRSGDLEGWSQSGSLVEALGEFVKKVVGGMASAG